MFIDWPLPDDNGKYHATYCAIGHKYFAHTYSRCSGRACLSISLFLNQSVSENADGRHLPKKW